jgi:hypothetical protein
VQYGINKENINNPEETAPYYFVDRFAELLALIRRQTGE